MNSKPWILRKVIGALFCAGSVALVGCNSNQPPAAAPAGTASAPAPAASAGTAQAAPYMPPTADQLYQMVAPIALFPDKLVAQVLAGSTYPEQIAAADNEVAQNPSLTGASLQTAIAQQPWDASVKGLTAFPSVLDQMAKNVEWTTALGEAYVNDPTDVMNAIQVMRQRASKSGNLRSSAQQHVVTTTQSATTSYADAGYNDGSYPVYSGPAVVDAPEQVIEIEPAQDNTVYVPQYDSQVVYGDEVPDYPGYAYERPREYSGGDVATVGAVTFGVGILVGALLEQHHDRDRGRQDYGWHSWGMNWGGRDDNRGGRGDYRDRPAVIHNDTAYVSRSNTVVNRYVTNNNSNNVRDSHNVQNSGNPSRIGNHPAPAPAPTPASGPGNNPRAPAPRAMVNTPHFGPTATQRGAPNPERPHGLAGAPGNPPPHAVVTPPPHGPMTMPHFDKNPQRRAPIVQGPRAAPHVRNTLAPAPGAVHAVPNAPRAPNNLAPRPGVVGMPHTMPHTAPNNLAPRTGVVNMPHVAQHIAPGHPPAVVPNHALPGPSAPLQRQPHAPAIQPATQHAQRIQPHVNVMPAPRPVQQQAPRQQPAARPVQPPRPQPVARPVQQPHMPQQPHPMQPPRQMPQAARPVQPARQAQQAPHPAPPAHLDDKKKKDDKHDHR